MFDSLRRSKSSSSKSGSRTKSSSSGYRGATFSNSHSTGRPLGKAGIIAISVVFGVLFLTAIGVLLFFWLRKRRRTAFAAAVRAKTLEQNSEEEAFVACHPPHLDIDRAWSPAFLSEKSVDAEVLVTPETGSEYQAVAEGKKQ